MGCEKEARNILDHQDKKRRMLESYIVSKNNEEFKIKEIEDLINYIKDDPKRAERLFNHL